MPDPKPFPLRLREFVGNVAAEAASKVRFRLKLSRTTPPVIVCQMGKVGSTSIYRSLLQSYPGAVAHAHVFSRKSRRYEARVLHRWAVVEKKPLHVITLTREPVGRNVSAFFENFERDTGVPYAGSKFSIDELAAIFLEKYLHHIPLTWFDDNVLANFGIDVFATPFPESGIGTYVRDNVRLLVMRVETSDEDKTRAIADFLGLPGFRLQNENIAERKDYAPAYQAFKDTVRFSPDYLDRMCDSKYFRHFYSAETIAKVRKKWSNS